MTLQFTRATGLSALKYKISLLLSHLYDAESFRLLQFAQNASQKKIEVFSKVFANLGQESEIWPQNLKVQNFDDREE